MSDTPRLLTMKPYEWEAVERTIDEHSALEPSYVDALHSEVLAQAARVQALEQDVETLANSCNSLERETVRLEQERERIRQALSNRPEQLRRAGIALLEIASLVDSRHRKPYLDHAKYCQDTAEAIASLPPAGEREET